MDNPGGGLLTVSIKQRDLINVLLPVVKAIHDSSEAILTAWNQLLKTVELPQNEMGDPEKMVCSVCNYEWWAARSPHAWVVACPACGSDATMLVE